MNTIQIIELFGEARRCLYRWGVIMYHCRFGFGFGLVWRSLQMIIELFGGARRCLYRWGVIMYHWRLFSGDPVESPPPSTQTSEHQTVIKKFIFHLACHHNLDIRIPSSEVISKIETSDFSPNLSFFFGCK